MDRHDTSLAYDLGRKAKLYADFEIAELWVVDVNDRVVTIHTNPSEGAYASIETHGFDATLTAYKLTGYALDLKAYGS
ncbi:MAG: Uma2 family endonuclease [Pseudomonadota bacterium]